MRRIFKTAMSAVLSLAMVASLAVSYAPKAEAAEKTAPLSPWTFFQTGTSTWAWNAWEVCAFDKATLTSGEVLDAQFGNHVDGVDDLPEATITSTTAADGFTADIISNGWSGSYVGSTLAGDNPYTVRAEMHDIALEYGHKYTFSFKFNATSQKRFSVTLKGGDNQYDFKEYTYTEGNDIVHSFDFTYEENSVTKASIIFMMGAWVYSQPSETNWTGTVTVSDLKFVDKGMDPAFEKYTVTYMNDGKELTNNRVEKGTKVTPPAIEKKGYVLTGWYNGNTKYDFSKGVTSDVKLTAKWAKVKKPARAKIKSAKSNAHKRLTVKVKKVKGADGYIIQVARNKKFTKKLKEVTSTKVKTVVKKLKAGKKHYVRVKAFKLDSAGNKIVSKKWSKKKARWIS